MIAMSLMRNSCDIVALLRVEARVARLVGAQALQWGTIEEACELQIFLGKAMSHLRVPPLRQLVRVLR